MSNAKRPRFKVMDIEGKRTVIRDCLRNVIVAEAFDLRTDDAEKNAELIARLLNGANKK